VLYATARFIIAKKKSFVNSKMKVFYQIIFSSVYHVKPPKTTASLFLVDTVTNPWYNNQNNAHPKEQSYETSFCH